MNHSFRTKIKKVKIEPSSVSLCIFPFGVVEVVAVDEEGRSNAFAGQSILKLVKITCIIIPLGNK